MDQGAKERKEKDVIAILIGLGILSIMVILVVKFKFYGSIESKFLLLDAYIGSFIHKIFPNLYTEADNYLQIAKQITDTIRYEGVYVSRIGNQYYPVVDKGMEYFKYINYVFYGFFTVIFTFLFFKFSHVTKNFYTGIKNKKMTFYFPEIDKIIQNFKRKTIKGIKGEQFATMDYFPAYMPDDEEWFENFVHNSIEFSQHPINTSKRRYNMIHKVWESIIDEKSKITKTKTKDGKIKKKKEISILDRYMFERYMYIDKNEISGNHNELLIFLNNRNKNYEGIPQKNLFTYNNSNETVKEYIKEFYRYLIKKGQDIDFTEIILNDLKIYFEVRLFRKNKDTAKTYFNSIKKGKIIKTPFLVREPVDGILFEQEAEKIAEKNNIPVEKAKEQLKKERIKINKEREVIAKKYYGNLINLALGGSSDIRFKQPVLKRSYILTPIGGKSLNEFETLGSKIIVKILEKIIIKDYEGSLLKQIEKLKKENAELERKLKSPFLKNDERRMYQDSIELNNAIISDIENNIAVNNSASRKAKLKELRKTHKFEETYLVALWEYGMTLSNLPTGRLSLIKKENMNLWYALTSLGRPFVFKAGMPIMVMKEIEKEINSKIRQIEKEYENADKIDDVLDEDFINMIKQEALNYEEEYQIIEDDESF